MTEFSPGTRVRIDLNHHWACNELATVVDQPGWPRTVQGRRGAMRFFFVEFDVPQMDADGDGPYRGGEIEGRFLSLA